MSKTTVPAPRHNGASVFVSLAIGAIVGIAFAGYILKTPAPAARAAAPVAAMDYAAITAAVKAGFPVAAAPAPAAAAPVATQSKPKPRPRVSKPARVVYYVVAPARCGCAL